MEPWRRLRFGVAAFAGVLVVGTLGYVALGFPLLDAAYQTVTTVSTVGYREVRPLSDVGRIFTMGLILVGVATALYTFTLVLETVVEGHVQEVLGRKRLVLGEIPSGEILIAIGTETQLKALAAVVRP